MKTWNGLESLELRTLFTAGAIDTSFGNKGIVVGQANVTLNNVDASQQAKSIAEQSDGKLIIAGDDGGSDLFVARTDSKGNLDPSFGNAGITSIQFGNSSATFTGLAIDKNDRIVVAGTIQDSSGVSHFVIARITADGKLDTQFGKSGEANVSFGQSHATANSLTIDSHGRLIVAGSSDSGDSTGAMAVARFTPSGHLDTEFSLDGRQTIDIGGGQDSANAIAVSADGSLFLAGETTSKAGRSDLAVVSLTSAGQLDRTFNATGMAAIDFGDDNVQATAILLQTDHKIVLAGGDISNEYGPHVMARLVPDGSLDTTFSHDGKLSPKEFPVAMQNATQIIRASDGYYRIYDDYSESRVSFGGNTNLTFGENAVLIIAPGDQSPAAMLVKPDDSAITVMTEDDLSQHDEPTAIDIASIDSNQNEIFGSQIVFDQGESDVAVDPSGKLLAIGLASGSFAVYRFDADGSPDSQFGELGRTVLGSSAITAELLPMGDGSYIVDGTGEESDEDDDVAIDIARGNADGTDNTDYINKSSNDDPDLYYDETENGEVELLPHGYVFASLDQDWTETGERDGHLIAPDGQTTEAGFYENPNTNGGPRDYVDSIIPFRDTGAVLVEYEVQDQVLDQNGLYTGYYTDGPTYLKKVGPGASSFGKNGILKGSYDLLDAQPGGKILYLDDTTGGLRRLNANGTPDSTFGTHGLAASGYGSFTVDAHNRIIAWKARKDGSIQIARFTSNGQPDKSFNGNGIAIVHSPVQNNFNLLVTPNDDIVLTALTQSGSTVKWSAIRIKGS